MNAEIRKLVKEKMKAEGISINRLAEDLDTPRPNMSRLLNGRIGKVPESWQKIFDRLGLELTVVPKKTPKK